MTITCDHCGPAISAGHEVTKGNNALHLCGHCVRKFKAALIREGWNVNADVEVYMLAR